MIVPGNEDPEVRRQIRIRKIEAHLGLRITVNNMMYVCKQAGLPFPRGVDFNDFPDWLDDNLQPLPDQDLIHIMKNLGLTVVMGPEDFNGVFIIHSGKDKALADRITRSLNVVNINDSMIYYSSGEETGTRLGTSFVDTIFKCLRNARMVICIISHGSMESSYCQQEIGAAMALDKHIIPILDGVDPGMMPGFLDNTRYIAANLESLDGAKSFLKEVCKTMDVGINNTYIALGAQKIISS